MSSREDDRTRQDILGDFGEFILDCEDLQEILDEACRLIAEALDADLAKVIEIDRKSDTGLVRAGVGWNKGVVGHARIDLDENSSEAYAIKKSEPVITQNIEQEDRFHFPDFLKDHGVVAIVNVPIFLPGRKPWGLLQVDAREPRSFADEEIQFLKTYSMVLGPVIDRLQTAVELDATGERLRLIVENAHNYVVVLSDPDDNITAWLAGSEEILGWSADEVLGRSVSILFTAEDREAGLPAQELAGAREEGAAPNVRWHVRRDGSRVFLDGQTVALREGNGEIRGYLKIAQDLTERKRHQERQAVLLAELQHRVRNVLAMVRSLVLRTVNGNAPSRDLAELLTGRIDALARTQALLTREAGVGVDLEQIIREEMEAQSADERRLGIEGPTVELSSKAAETLTLGIHELATNASKYGALRQDAGKLSVRWRVESEQEVRWLRLEWLEENVSVAGPQERRTGFGTELVAKRVPYELGGRGGIEFTDDGVRATIEFPLAEGSSVLESSGPA